MSAASAKTKERKSAAAFLKDPKGGLTAAGRAHFAQTEGSHLKPGVKKPEREMSPEEMRRKGSFLRRHYGRAEPLPLQDEKGKPTRHALQAHAWGEPGAKDPGRRAEARRQGHPFAGEGSRRQSGCEAQSQGRTGEKDRSQGLSALGRRGMGARSILRGPEERNGIACLCILAIERPA